MIALSLIGYVRRSQAVSSIVKVQVWHICCRLPLSLSKLLELWLFLLEELPDCWKRNRTSIQTKKPSLCIRHCMVRHYVTHCLSQPSFSQFWKHCEVTESMGPDIRRELSMPCFLFLNIWHVHLIFFEFIFFLLLSSRKNKTAQAVKRLLGLILTGSGILCNELFLQIFFFVVLLSHKGFSQLMSQGLFCKVPVVRHLCWVRHKR